MNGVKQVNLRVWATWLNRGRKWGREWKKGTDMMRMLLETDAKIGNKPKKDAQTGRRHRQLRRRDEWSKKEQKRVTFKGQCNHSSLTTSRKGRQPQTWEDTVKETSKAWKCNKWFLSKKKQLERWQGQNRSNSAASKRGWKWMLE